MAAYECEILQVGDERLRLKSEDVLDVKDETFIEERTKLARVLQNFRDTNGFGRAIAAPQIGINKRFIACDLGHGKRFCVINPVITKRSEETFTMWDDCFSFPWLLVKVRRHKSISMKYINEFGDRVEWEDMGIAESELFQHEIDHLDGILSFDRTEETNFGDAKKSDSPSLLLSHSLLSRDVYLKNPAYYNSLVDYFISPTI